MDKDLERVERMYPLVLSLVVNYGKVQIKNDLFSVDFIAGKKRYLVKTTDVHVSSRYFCSVYDIVKFMIAEKSFSREIEIISNDKVFAVIK